jgi:hypothetical protein
VREPITFALITLLRSKRLPLTDAVEDAARAVGHSAVQLTIRIAIKGTAGWILCFFGYPRQFERLAVVERCVPAAMSDDHRVLGRYLVEVMHVERAFVLELGVVVEIALNPEALRGLTRFCAEFLDDAGNGDEFDFEWIADEDFVEQRGAARVIMAVDEAGHDRHLLRIEGLGALPDEPFDVGGAPYSYEPAGVDRKRLRSRDGGIDGVDPGVKDDEVGVGTL